MISAKYLCQCIQVWKTTLVELGRTLGLEECALWMPTRTELELQLSYTLRHQNPVGFTIPIHLPTAQDNGMSMSWHNFIKLQLMDMPLSCDEEGKNSLASGFNFNVLSISTISCIWYPELELVSAESYSLSPSITDSDLALVLRSEILLGNGEEFSTAETSAPAAIEPKDSKIQEFYISYQSRQTPSPEFLQRLNLYHPIHTPKINWVIPEASKYKRMRILTHQMYTKGRLQ
nr:hypothetical protein DM860_017457 [Ipomoea trifida]